MAQGINIGGIYADLDIKTGNLEQGLAKGRAAIMAAEAELKRLNEEFERGTLDMATHNARSLELAKTMTDLAAKMQAANAAIGVTSNGFGVYNAGLNAATGAGSKFGQGLMQIGYAVDDLQYGFSAIVNNIGPIVAGLGGGAGLAGGLQIAAVAVNYMSKHWTDLLGVLGGGKVETEAEEMTRLGKATKLTADEAERLYNLKQLTSKDAEISRGKTKSEKDSEATATEAIVEAGADQVLGGVLKLSPDRFKEGAAIRKSLDYQKQRLADFTGPYAGAENSAEHATDARKQIAELEAELKAAATRFLSTSAFTQAFPKGPGELAALIDQSPGEFGPNAARLSRQLKGAQSQADRTPADREREQEDAAYEEIEDLATDHKHKEHKQNAAIDKAFYDDEKGSQGLQEKRAREDKQSLAQVATWEKQDAAEQARIKREKAAEDKKEASDAQRKGHEMLPGFKQMADVAAAQVESGRANLVDARKALNAKLEGAGLSKEEAVKAGGEEFADARVRVNDMAARRRGGLAGENMPRSQSEVYSTSSLTDKIQSSIGVGGDGTKQVAANTQEMIKILQEIAKQKGLRIEVKK